MTTRDLFNIILKILGIFFIKDFLTLIPETMSIFFLLTEPGVLSEILWSLISVILVLSVYGVASYYMIFKTGFIIDKLKLDKGFDQETIPLNIHRSTILSISVIVIGGFLFTDALPSFCQQVYAYFQEKRLTQGMTTPKISYMILSAAKILIGIYLMTAQRQVVKFIEWKRTK